MVETRARAARSARRRRCPRRSRGRVSRRVQALPDHAARARCAPDERAQRWLLGDLGERPLGPAVFGRARAGAAPHQPAARQDHHAGRARRGHLPDRRPGAAAEPHADRRSRPSCSTRSRRDATRCPLGSCMPLPAISAAEPASPTSTASTPSSTRARESEFAEDRLPGAVNWPSLDDDERARRRHRVQAGLAVRGAGSAARRWSRATSPRHIEREVLDKPRDWPPLVYCWRGGKRSGALALVLDQIGFRVHVLEGGYKAFRRAVVGGARAAAARASTAASSAGRPARARAGCCTALAARGRAGARPRRRSPTTAARCSASCPGSAQPSQKAFETRGLGRAAPLRSGAAGVRRERKQEGRRPARARGADRAHARSRRACWLELPLRARACALLMEDYDFFVDDVDAFCARLDALRALRGNEVVDGLAGGRAQRAASPRSCATCWSRTTTRSTCSRCGATSAASSRRRRSRSPPAMKRRCAAWRCAAEGRNDSVERDGVGARSSRRPTECPAGTSAVRRPALRLQAQGRDRRRTRARRRSCPSAVTPCAGRR